MKVFREFVAAIAFLTSSSQEMFLTRLSEVYTAVLLLDVRLNEVHTVAVKLRVRLGEVVTTIVKL